jgi:hypothetical protein
MHVDLARQGYARRQQQRRPQDAVEAADVLADQMERVGELRGRGAGPRRARPSLTVQVLELVLTRRAGTAHVALARQPPERVTALRPAERREVVE